METADELAQRMQALLKASGMRSGGHTPDEAVIDLAVSYLAQIELAVSS
jgi:hypothetical protein